MALDGSWGSCVSCVFGRLGNFGGRAAGQGAPGQNDQPAPRRRANPANVSSRYDCSEDLLVLQGKRPLLLDTFCVFFFLQFQSVHVLLRTSEEWTNEPRSACVDCQLFASAAGPRY